MVMVVGGLVKGKRGCLKDLGREQPAEGRNKWEIRDVSML